MSVSPTIEEYLEAIYLVNSEGRPAMGARLAELLRVSPPTVTGAIKRMQRDGYVAADAGKGIFLTPAGREIAEALVRRHELSERLLTDLLGVDWHAAHEEACRLEHAISPALEKKLAAALGHPTTCPHGNPIPGAGAHTPTGENQFLLSEAAAGQAVLVRRVSEEAEPDGELLAHLDRHGLRPGARVQVSEVLPVNGTITLQVAGRTVILGLTVAGKLWVAKAA